MSRFLLLLSFVAGLACAPALGAIYDTQRDCKAFQHLAQKLPDKLGGQGQTMIRVCNWGGKRHYALLFPPARGRYNVCKSSQVRFLPKQFLNGDSNGEPIVDGDVVDSDLAAASTLTVRSVIKGKCPPQDDDQYVETRYMTDGVFAAAMNSLASATASEAAFDAAFANLVVRPSDAANFARFKRIALDPKHSVMEQVNRVYGEMTFGQVFEISIVDPDSGLNQGYDLGFDVGNGAIDFMDFEVWTSP